MTQYLIKHYPEEFKEVLKEYDVFDHRWNDWQYIAFFVDKGLEIFIDKERYRLSYKGKVLIGEYEFDKFLVNCFNIYKHVKISKLHTIGEGEVL